jgi:hypothetical protein
VEPVVVSPGDTNLFNAIGITLMDVFFWFAIFGALTFWVLIPAGRQAQTVLRERREAE